MAEDLADNPKTLNVYESVQELPDMTFLEKPHDLSSLCTTLKENNIPYERWNADTLNALYFDLASGEKQLAMSKLPNPNGNQTTELCVHMHLASAKVNATIDGVLYELREDWEATVRTDKDGAATYKTPRQRIGREGAISEKHLPQENSKDAIMRGIDEELDIGPDAYSLSDIDTNSIEIGRKPNTLPSITEKTLFHVTLNEKGLKHFLRDPENPSILTYYSGEPVDSQSGKISKFSLVPLPHEVSKIAA